MNYLTLIADIVASKTIPDRTIFQRGLQTTLNAINRRSQTSLASPYTITLGDEFQAVYQDAETVFNDIFSIVSWAYPWQIRFSLTCGPLSTDINQKQAIGMDGPAFVDARRQLEQQKKEHRTTIACQLPNEEKTILVNAFLSALCHLTELWNANAHTVFTQVLAGEETAEIAAAAELSLSTTYKHIREKHMHEYAAALRAIEQTINAEIAGTTQP